MMIELDYAHDGGVALLTLKRPPANAFTPESLLQLQRTAACARDAALTMAARVVGLSPQAVSLSKTLIHQARNGVPRSAALAFERERFVDLFDGADQREGVNAFLQKRKLRWQAAGAESTGIGRLRG